MKIINETKYDWRAFLSMNRTVTRANNRLKSLVLRGLGAAAGLALCYGFHRLGPGLLGGSMAILGGVILLWVVLLNYIRAFIMEKLIMKGAHSYTNTFGDEGWSIVSSNGEKQDMAYSDVTAIVENSRYLTLMVSERQGYILDKQGFQGGMPADFYAIIEEKTGKTIQKV